MTPTRGWAFFATTACFAAVLCVCGDAPAATVEPPDRPADPVVGRRGTDRWSFEATPYIFLPKIEANITAGGVSSSSTMSIGDVLDNLDGGMLLRMECMKGPWGFYFEPEYLSLSAQIDGPDAYRQVDVASAVRKKVLGRLPPGMTPEQARKLALVAWRRLTPAQKAAARRLKSRLSSLYMPHIDEVDIKLEAVLLDAGMFYRLLDRPLSCPYARHVQFDLMGGARYVYMKTTIDIDVKPGSLGLFPEHLKSESRKDWVDPVIGARTRIALTDKLLFSLRGDVGGFGVGSGSDLSWQVVAGLGYRVSDSVMLSAGYRQLDIDYKSGDDKELDMTMKGPFLACTIRF